MTYQARHARPRRRRRYTLAAVLAAVAAVLAIVAGCTNDSKPGAQAQGQSLTEQAYKAQAQAQPYPANELTNSLERANVKRKLLAENKADALGYVYLQSFGKVLGYYTIKGKVSSNNSQMTTDQLVNRYCENGECAWMSVNAPGDDGSYGPNEPGVFFFTTEGTLVKTDLDYVYSTQPLPFNVPQLNK